MPFKGLTRSVNIFHGKYAPGRGLISTDALSRKIVNMGTFARFTKMPDGS